MRGTPEEESEKEGEPEQTGRGAKENEEQCSGITSCFGVKPWLIAVVRPATRATLRLSRRLPLLRVDAARRLGAAVAAAHLPTETTRDLRRRLRHDQDVPGGCYADDAVDDARNRSKHNLKCRLSFHV